MTPCDLCKNFLYGDYNLKRRRQERFEKNGPAEAVYIITLNREYDEAWQSKVNVCQVCAKDKLYALSSCLPTWPSEDTYQKIN